MIVTGLSWIERRLRPADGWLPFLLLLAIILILTLAVVDADWVPEVSIVFVTGFTGLALGIALARRPLGWLPAWLLIIAYGLALTTVLLGRLAPPPNVVLRGWTPISEHIRRNWGLFIDRAGGWLAIALGEGRSEETVVFAFAVGLLAWLLAAFAGWTIFRGRRPWASLIPLTLALALNNYYSQAELWYVPIFVGLLVALVATVGYADREAGWTRRKVDYSGEIRIELLVYSGAIALFLFFVATALPAINFRAISDAVLNRPAVDQAERTLDRVFAGVRQPGPSYLAGEGALEAGGSHGTLPRTFLLGAPPELYETVVMTATAHGDSTRAAHWRGLSYDVYTGRGWAVSAESRESVAAGQPIRLPEILATTAVTQTIVSTSESGRIRYSLGLPLRFDQAVTTRWRGLEDLSRVEGQGGFYTAVSRLSAATPAELRDASLAELSPALKARYTALPDSIPERIHALANQVAGESDLPLTPYDQAKALEAFLRQYPYSLDVELPPADSDPVDYFLFDLQAGYCDYYASAMVVMARSLGLPARLAAGYLAQPAGSDGVQTITQINAHSWTEVYFADYGWLEFEPTAAFAAESAPLPAPEEQDVFGSEATPSQNPPPIPEPARDYAGFFWLLALLPLLLVGWWFWRARHQPWQRPADRAQWASDRLQRRAGRLGQLVQASQTPAEFSDAFLLHLDHLNQRRLARRLDLVEIKTEIRQLATAFAGWQYAQHKPPIGEVADSWRRVRWRLWILNVGEDLRGLWPNRLSKRE